MGGSRGPAVPAPGEIGVLGGEQGISQAGTHTTTTRAEGCREAPGAGWGLAGEGTKLISIIVGDGELIDGGKQQKTRKLINNN